MATRYQGEFRLSPVVFLQSWSLIIVSGRLDPAVELHLTAPIKPSFHAICLDTQSLQAITLHKRQEKSGSALPASIFDV